MREEARSSRRIIDTCPVVYPKKRDPDQGFWAFARTGRPDIPWPLVELAKSDAAQGPGVGIDTARWIVSYLQGVGFGEETSDDHPMPVLFVDADGAQVVVGDSARSAVER
jgi:hypothetical protein